MFETHGGTLAPGGYIGCFVEGSSPPGLAVEKKLDDTKYPLAAAPYDPSAPRTLRIRHDSRPAAGIDDVVFELSAAPVATPDGTIGAAGASTGAAGYVELYREPWDARIDVRSLTFELKAGTSDKESSPGTVVWDNFRAALARRLSVP